MQQNININTGLSDFMLIDRIVKAEKQAIHGQKTFSDSPAYLGIEALAQLGAFHVRYIRRFNCHAFLLKINHCQIPAHTKFNGEFELFGTLESRSTAAFSYTLLAKQNNIIKVKGEFLFSTVDYDHNFKKEKLKNHYQGLFSCLHNDSEKE